MHRHCATAACACLGAHRTVGFAASAAPSSASTASSFSSFPLASSSAAMVCSAASSAVIGPSTGSATAIRGQMRHQSQTGAIPSAVMGAVTPYKGFFSSDVHIDLSSYGGQFARGLFAKRSIPYGREILRVPAFATYVGDEERREQVFILAQQVFSEMVARGDDDPYTIFVKERIFTLMSSGRQYFLREQDLQRLLDAVPGSNRFLDMGRVTPSDIQKLPQQLEFNRHDIEFRGKKGICIFPEASYFNHMCIPNVEVSISYELSEGGFILSARTCRPVEAGDELFINYIPDNDMPLSRLVLAMRSRWGFECSCSSCRNRLLGICAVLLVLVALPFIWLVRNTFESRFRDRARRLN